MLANRYAQLSPEEHAEFSELGVAATEYGRGLDFKSEGGSSFGLKRTAAFSLSAKAQTVAIVEHCAEKGHAEKLKIMESQSHDLQDPGEGWSVSEGGADSAEPLS